MPMKLSGKPGTRRRSRSLSRHSLRGRRHWLAITHLKEMILMSDPLSPDLLRRMHAYWRAANYLSIGQIYLQDNPLLETPLKLEHIKPRLLGHWGTTPGLNFLYVHLNRL